MGCWKNFKTKLLHLICEMFIRHLVSLCEYNNSSCCVKLNLLTAWAAEVRLGGAGGYRIELFLGEGCERGPVGAVDVRIGAFGSDRMGVLHERDLTGYMDRI